MEEAAEFLAGGCASVIAETLTLPADTLKVRLQILGQRATILATLRNILINEGVGAFFQGLDAAVLRQALYGSLRYGLYPHMQRIVTELLPQTAPKLARRLLAGCASGAISSALCNPTDLIKIRMQGNTLQKNTSLYKAFADVLKNEGIVALWTTGVGPTVMRAAVLAAVEMAAYDTIKPVIASSTSSSLDSALTHILAATIASFFSSFCSCPFDLARSRVMNQKKDEKGKPLEYAGAIDCLAKSVRKEGILVLWSGWMAFFIRLGPNTILTFFFLERLRVYFDMLLRR